MISNSKLIFYACIAKGTTVLAEYTSEEDASNNLQGLALECLHKTPPFHSRFSHTVKRRTYTFFIEDPFVYFAISHEDPPKSEVLWFLNRIKSGFEEMGYGRSMMGPNGFVPFCFQSQFDSFLREALALDLESVNSTTNVENQHGNSNSDSSVNGMMVVQAPLLRQTSKGLKNKKRMGVDGIVVGVDGKDVAFENKLDVRDDSESPMLRGLGNDRQKARQIWKKHVWVVLLLDLSVCTVLFGIWLWVCWGFKCIDGS